MIGWFLLTQTFIRSVTDLSNPQKKFKVEKNAAQLQMTGTAIVNPTMGLVIVEGTPKAMKRYKKLMLRRIDWNDDRAAREAGDDDDSDEDSDEEDTKPAAAAPASAAPADGSAPKKRNECHLVWEGEMKDRAFRRFRTSVLPTEYAAKELLEKFGAAQYWDIAKNYTPPEAIL